MLAMNLLHHDLVLPQKRRHSWGRNNQTHDKWKIFVLSSSWTEPSLGLELCPGGPLQPLHHRRLTGGTTPPHPINHLIYSWLSWREERRGEETGGLVRWDRGSLLAQATSIPWNWMPRIITEVGLLASHALSIGRLPSSKLYWPH